MGNKETALFKITGSFGIKIKDVSASCGECNKSYPGDELKGKEEKLDNAFYKSRFTWKCPEGHIVLGADV